jgi:hypothetical protein
MGDDNLLMRLELWEEVFPEDMDKEEGHLYYEASDRIKQLFAITEALTAERDQWIQHAKNAVWADSEELKLLTADNVRLRGLVQEADDLIGYALPSLQWKRECREFRVKARAALTGKADT